MIVRAPGNTARGKRLRDLFSAFLTTMGAPTDVVAQANALAAAELIVAGEEARARLLAGTGNVDEVVRIENLAARAAKRLDVGRKREHKPRSIEELVAS